MLQVGNHLLHKIDNFRCETKLYLWTSTLILPLTGQRNTSANARITVWSAFFTHLVLDTTLFLPTAHDAPTYLSSFREKVAPLGLKILWTEGKLQNFLYW